jgi:hypothetical protein
MHGARKRPNSSADFQSAWWTKGSRWVGSVPRGGRTVRRLQTRAPENVGCTCGDHGLHLDLFFRGLEGSVRVHGLGRDEPGEGRAPLGL